MSYQDILSMGRDANGTPAYIRNIPSVIFNFNIAANTPYSFQVPLFTNCFFGSYSGGGVWVRYDGQTAVIPAAGISQRQQEFNPLGVFVNPGQTLSIISATNSEGSFTFYNLTGGR